MPLPLYRIRVLFIKCIRNTQKIKNNLKAAKESKEQQLPFSISSFHFLDQPFKLFA